MGAVLWQTEVRQTSRVCQEQYRACLPVENVLHPAFASCFPDPPTGEKSALHGSIQKFVSVALRADD